MPQTTARGTDKAPDGPEAAELVRSASPWSPFRQAAFASIWVATVISNIGSWMHDTAAGWLITELDSNPLIVSLVQVAASLPLFLFALPAGALADIVDRRRLLLMVEAAAMVLTAILATLVLLDLVTPTPLLLFTFLINTFAALVAPAWQAVVPELVPKSELQSALALNSIGINVSRTIGPALGGVTIAAIGIAAPFWLDAVSTLAVLAALVWWRPRPKAMSHLPVERLGSGVRAGLRYARNNPSLRATLIRAFGFFLFASAYWALLPLLARKQVVGGPDLYGLLLGAIGVGAVGGAIVLPRARKLLGSDKLVHCGGVGTALALVLFGLAKTPEVAVCAALVAGLSWVAAISSLSFSAQSALPEWVRGRGSALFVSVMFGTLSVGSAVWGQVAVLMGLPSAHLLAAAGACLIVPATARWKLLNGGGGDLTPSKNWPEPVLDHEIQPDQGPVMVTIEYRIDPKSRDPFLEALNDFAEQRKRDGAYRWGVFEDVAAGGRFLETFLVDSWLDHLRQHERTTNADRVVEDCVNRFHAEGAPKVTHFVAPARNERL
ncbi:Predicted arabinose efflux permease, MFS family [Rhizobiales bacterium GAS113]|nr:Predicted arabinose efflux permease, MFS family [Rhizobiales bacterium GAS113]